MRHIVSVLTLLAAAASPAWAGRDWDDGDDYYYDDGYAEHRYWRGESRAVRAYPYRAPSYEVYIPPYGHYFADDPHVYGPNCKIERKWRRGSYREKIECDDDD